MGCAEALPYIEVVYIAVAWIEVDVHRQECLCYLKAVEDCLLIFLYDGRCLLRFARC